MTVQKGVQNTDKGRIRQRELEFDRNGNGKGVRVIRRRGYRDMMFPMMISVTAEVKTVQTKPKYNMCSTPNR